MRKRQAFTPQEDAEIRRRIANNESPFAFAKDMGREGSTLYKHARVLGLTPPTRRTKGGKLTLAKAAIRRMNGKGPKVRLMVMTGKAQNTFTNVEAATNFLVRERLQGHDARLYREIQYELTAELKGRVE